MADGLNRLGVAAGAAGALAAGAFGYLLRRPLPQVEGEIRLKGLAGPVEIVRDRWGIPHISARDPLDAFFGQGFCHAQDRLWAMELGRRLAAGRLAEVFGQGALDVDRFQRRVGLYRAARREWELADSALRDVLLAYSAGVNACLDGLLATNKLPVEFVLARFHPERWDPIDSLGYGRYLAYSQSPNWESELVRSRLIARVGYAAAARLEPDVWHSDTDALPRLADWGPPDMPEPSELPPLVLPGGPGASNAWAVAGTRSSTGKPLLANDPHMLPRFPSVFYEAHLAAGGELNVAGASAPGAPGILIGHNRHIAWGLTASMADTQDLYVERIDPGDPRRTEFDGRWESGTAIREVINVKGAHPWVEEVLVTRRHGPLLTPTPSLGDEHRPLALRSMVLEAPGPAAALLDLNRATSWAEFRAAARRWGTPSMNLIYADTAGNIGYQMVGHVPIRTRGEGLVPSPGWSKQYEWRGVVPFDELPMAFNPADGLWANANHDTSRLSPTHFFTREYIDSARYRRIRQVLESKTRHSAVDFGALQADEVSLPAREVAALLTAHVRAPTPLSTRALDELRAWDGQVSSDSVAATVYEVFRNELLKARHGDELGDLLPAILGHGPHPLLAAVTSHYFLQTGRVLGFLRASPDDPIVQTAFDNSIAWLRRTLGPTINTWQWGRLHPLRLQHALSLRKPLGMVFDIPGFPWSGDLETVRAGGSAAGRYEASGPISAYRLIADCGDWDNTLSCVPGGQSGHRGSPHYADQVEAWRRVAYHPLSFTRPAIARVQRHVLRLTPDS